jgi:uncharacterized protein
MTPQESQLVGDLFDRLAKLETAPRDAEAERLIIHGLRRAPHAVYALVQTTLLQDEALKRANARIEELQARETDAEGPEQRQGSFLDSMRQALGGGAPRGSVPNVRAAAGYQSQQGPQPQAGYPPQMQPGYPGAPGFGSGGSFLGTAASAAAGVIGGSLLLDGIRGMFGHHAGGSGPFGTLADERASPWRGGAADTEAARRADEKQDAEQDRADDADEQQDAQQDLDDDDDDFADSGDDSYDA